MTCDVPTAPNYGTPNGVVYEICELQHIVVQHIDPDYSRPYDCFCGKNDCVWPGGRPSLSWRNCGAAVEFMKLAVAEKVERDTLRAEIAALKARASKAEAALSGWDE